MITLGGDPTALIEALSSAQINNNFLNRGLLSLLFGKLAEYLCRYLTGVQLNLFLAYRAIQVVEHDSLGFSFLIDPLVHAFGVKDVITD